MPPQQVPALQEAHRPLPALFYELERNTGNKRSRAETENGLNQPVVPSANDAQHCTNDKGGCRNRTHKRADNTPKTIVMADASRRPGGS